MVADTNLKQDAALLSTRGVKRRARILTAFHDCIISKGYAKTTLRDVAQMAGMTASHLLYYFSGKDTMLEHFFDAVAQTIIERIESFRSEDAEHQFELLADLFFRRQGHHPF